jgi:hypothetical protein
VAEYGKQNIPKSVLTEYEFISRSTWTFFSEQAKTLQQQLISSPNLRLDYYEATESENRLKLSVILPKEQSPNHIVTNQQEKNVHLTYLRATTELPKEHHGHLMS